MKLLRKVNNLAHLTIGKLKLSYFKILLKRNLKVGRNTLLKNTSRINIWDNEGTISIGDNFSMGYNSEIYSWNQTLTIGSSTSLNDNCKIYGSVKIGSNCLLASSIFLSSGTHSFSNQPSLPIKSQDKIYTINKPIVIEDDCWIGYGVVIMPGVYIGKGAIIGANSVVTKNVFPYTIHAGIPSREIGKRLDFRNSYTELQASDPDHWPFIYKGCDYKQFDNVASFIDGICIVESTSVFLLSKGSCDTIKIKGYGNHELKLKIYLNQTFYAEVITMQGLFEANIKLNIHNSNSPEFLESIPEDLKDKFNIIGIEVEQVQHVKTFLPFKWKVLSIGYEED